MKAFCLPSVRPTMTFSNDFSSEAVMPILFISHIASKGRVEQKVVFFFQMG